MKTRRAKWMRICHDGQRQTLAWPVVVIDSTSKQPEKVRVAFLADNDDASASVQWVKSFRVKEPDADERDHPHFARIEALVTKGGFAR